MSDLAALRLMSYVSMAFMFPLAIFALTTRFSPSLPGYLTFLFLGLIGSFAERSIRVLERRVSALESRK